LVPARPDDRLGPALVPLEVCPLEPPPTDGVDDEPAGATTAGA
jgi:hypothetical protein